MRRVGEYEIATEVVLCWRLSSLSNAIETRYAGTRRVATGRLLQQPALEEHVRGEAVAPCDWQVGKEHAAFESEQQEQHLAIESLGEHTH